MRNLFALGVLAAVAMFLVASPANAQGWSSYANARYGATADIPPGFQPSGPEATNSDGLIFRSRSGALLTIYGAPISGGNFEAFVEKTIAHDRSYNGWKVTGSRITPDWAEYSGNVGGRQLRMRVISSCGGHYALAAKIEYNGNMNSDVGRVFRSLKAGPAKSC